MKDLRIEVSSIANLVSNSDFSRWNQEIPTGWDVTPLSGNVIPFPFEGGFACGIVDIESATETYIAQNLGDSFTSGDNYTLNVLCRGSGTIYIQYDFAAFWLDLDSISFSSEDWESNVININISASNVDHRILILPDYDSDMPYFYVNVVNLYESDWYSNKKPLNIEEISSIENLLRDIEDDIFTFKSDAMDIELYNYGYSTTYFNTSDFLTNSNRIFRFDIKIDYNDTISKSIILFSNNDTIRRSQKSGSDTIKLSLYELPTLFKDNGWFLGTLSDGKYDDDGDMVEEPTYQYQSHNPGSSVFNANVPIADVISTLSVDIYNLMMQRVIPVRREDFNITNNLSGNSDKISIYYNETIGVGQGEYSVIDFVATPTNRKFLLLILSSEIFNSNSTIDVWELVNDSTLTKTDVTLRLPGIAYYQILGGGGNLAFIHNYSNATHYNYPSDSDIDGNEIEFAVIRTYRSGEQGNPVITDVKAYSNNTAVSNEDESEFDLVKLGEIFQAYDSSGEYYTYASSYIDDDGILVTDEGYVLDEDNFSWIANHTIEDTTENEYVLSDISTELWENSQGVTAGIPITYAQKLTAKIYRFSRYYTFRLENVTPSDILKELAVTQDAVWFLSYSGSNITVNLYARDTTDDIDDYWDDTDWLIKEEYVKMIKFDDLQSQLFNQDFERMKDLVGYYNNRYGNGRTEISAREWGWHDYDLRDIIRYNDKTYFIKQIALENYDYATNFRIFELWR